MFHIVAVVCCIFMKFDTCHDMYAWCFFFCYALLHHFGNAYCTFEFFLGLNETILPKKYISLAILLLEGWNIIGYLLKLSKYKDSLVCALEVHNP